MNTANRAKNIFGNELYQIRARTALPILVRQAKACTPITYQDLANELRMTNPRNLNYVLGSVGKTLNELSSKYQTTIPPIQTLVVNKNTGLPGKGISPFLNNDYSRLSTSKKRLVINKLLDKIYFFNSWTDILRLLGLEENKVNIIQSRSNKSAAYHNGESSYHKNLKILISNHPEIFKLPKFHTKVFIEQMLQSGDIIDILFKTKNQIVGVEVKSRISNLADIQRGLFQCVKYQAILEAEMKFNFEEINIKTILAMETRFPEELLPIRNVLSVNTFERIREKIK